MTTKEDKYFLWITSDLFGNIRLQHHNGIIEAVDDPRFKWTIGKPLPDIEGWVALKEKMAENDKLLSERNQFTFKQQREILYEEDRKRIAVLTRDRYEDQPTESRDGY